MAKLVGINHVALEVGDVDEALELYGRLFEFELRGRVGGGRMAFIDIGDQFLALQAGRSQPADEGRHFGLVVDDKAAVREAVEREGLEPARRCGAGSLSSTPGATTSRSSTTETSSSSAARASSASSGSNRSRRPSKRGPRSMRRAWLSLGAGRAA